MLSHTNWIEKSGIAERSSLEREHGFRGDLLETGLSYAQLDGPSVAIFEPIVCRVAQIETAVRQNSKAPDFDGLDIILEKFGDVREFEVIFVGVHPLHK